MNYCIIPKNNCNINIDLKILENTEYFKPHISFSLVNHLTNINNNLTKINSHFVDININIDDINKIVNPFEFIYTNVPGSFLAVSKVKPDANIFFEMIEVFNTCDINDIFSSSKKMKIANLSPNYTSVNYLLNMLREESEDDIINLNFNYTNLTNIFIKNKCETLFDLSIIEIPEYDDKNPQKYIYDMILTLCFVCRQQSLYSTCIIKIDNVFFKPILDIIFIFSTMFEKIYLFKPVISKITKGDRYIICKNFCINTDKHKHLLIQIQEKIEKIIKNNNLNSLNISSLLDNKIPYFFSNKIEEFNAVIGQQQLEACDLLINILKNKNREEKLETLKRNHIQKCIQWCERNNLPHNKFIDKTNIFLHSKKKEMKVEEMKVED